MWKANGAAIGYVAGESIAALISGWYVAHLLGFFRPEAIRKMAIPGLLSILLVWLPLHIASPIWAAIVICVYVCSVFVCGAFSVSDLRKLIMQASVLPTNS
jgi:hypothetical protein